MSPTIDLRGRQDPNACPECLRRGALEHGLPVELQINGARLTLAALVPLAMWTGALGPHLYIVARAAVTAAETYEARWHVNGAPGPALVTATGATPELALEALRAAMEAGSKRLLAALKERP